MQHQFSSRIGFILAAAGSAVGLGNIWGFPTEAASNGGGLFVMIYIAMIIFVGYPMLLAEVAIGHLGQSNPINSFAKLSNNRRVSQVLAVPGWLGAITVLVILSFYSIVGAWIVGAILEPFSLSTMFSQQSLSVLFLLVTMAVPMAGVSAGVERLSKFCMPLLLVLLVVLALFVISQPNANEGLRWYLQPGSFDGISLGLISSAAGQAFFSLSIGVTCMMVYGSYLKRGTNLPKTVAWVTAIDTCVALLAGLLILPALSIAKSEGINVYDAQGQLVKSDSLVFDVLPAVFQQFGTFGVYIAVCFFVLLFLAAITSSVSMLEAPVSTFSSSFNVSRKKATVGLTALAIIVSLVLSNNMASLFSLVVSVTTDYIQPILGAFMSLVLAWALRQSALLKELANSGHLESKFWRAWRLYILCLMVTSVTVYISTR